MLERFTEEEIAQIEKELKARNRKSQKEFVIGSQIERIEKLFPRDIYNGDGVGLYAASEIKTALLLICDHITNNYSVKTKRTVRQHGRHLFRATCIPTSWTQSRRTTSHSPNLRETMCRSSNCGVDKYKKRRYNVWAMRKEEL